MEATFEMEINPMTDNEYIKYIARDEVEAAVRRARRERSLAIGAMLRRIFKRGAPRKQPADVHPTGGDTTAACARSGHARAATERSTGESGRRFPFAHPALLWGRA